MSEESNLSPCAASVREFTQEVIYANTPSGVTEKKLRILHFNDVYNIEESRLEPKAGASRFSTALKMLQAEEPCLVLFSGDAFSPSSRRLPLYNHPLDFTNKISTFFFVLSKLDR